MFAHFDKLSANGEKYEKKIFSSVRPDASSSSAVNAALSSTRDCSNPVRPELVEGYELIFTLKEKCSYGSTRLR